MHAYVYILLSKKNNRTYTGSTINLGNRLKEHNAGKNKSTKHLRPWELIYYEEYDDLKQARKKEKYYKTHAGRKKLKEIFEAKSIAR